MAHEKDLLLSSLADFWSIIKPLLLLKKPATICEVGIGNGRFTHALIDFCKERSCHYTGIDPAVAPKKIGEPLPGCTTLLRQSSLETLSKLPRQDVCFIDGDHNHYTVLNELRQCVQGNQHFPLIFLHDVGWPWGRRDQYCNPDSIPAEWRHPFSTTLGVIPGRDELGIGGFSGVGSDYPYGAALHEGGPRNGVLTALEDWTKEQKDAWKFITLPGIFGLAILYAPEHCPRDLREAIDLLEKSSHQLGAFLGAMEMNRIELVLRHHRHMTEWKELHGDYKKLRESFADLTSHSATLLEQFNALHEVYKGLNEHSTQVDGLYQTLLSEHAALKRLHADPIQSLPVPIASSPPPPELI